MREDGRVDVGGSAVCGGFWGEAIEAKGVGAHSSAKGVGACSSAKGVDARGSADGVVES